MVSEMKKQIDKDIGPNLRVLRVAAKMSQEELGEALGVTFQQIQKYEKGVNRVQAGRLKMIAKALGCSVADIIETGDLSDDPALDLMKTAQGRKLAEGYLKLPHAQRDALLKMVEAWANV